MCAEYAAPNQDVIRSEGYGTGAGQRPLDDSGAYLVSLKLIYPPAPLTWNLNSIAFCTLLPISETSASLKIRALTASKYAFHAELTDIRVINSQSERDCLNGPTTKARVSRSRWDMQSPSDRSLDRYQA